MSSSQVRTSETLGRRISEPEGRKSKRAKRIRENFRARGEQGAPKQVVPTREFKPKMGETEISVDRISEAPREQIAAIAERDAAADARVFHGWATVPCERAMQEGRVVRASPIGHPHPPNPYHADIVFPDRVKDDEDERTAQAFHLAQNAEWLEWLERGQPGRKPFPPNFRLV